MDDEIDLAIARLEARRPGIDASPLALSARLIRLARHLELARREVLAARGLEIWEYDVLFALRSADSTVGLSPSALMAATQVASGTMTNRVERLLKHGLVSRTPDPRDQRGVIVRLSASGKRRVDQACAAIASAENALWGSISDQRRAQLNHALRGMLTAIEGTG
jgi:DNA-binding MarR family transcriptional regulator